MKTKPGKAVLLLSAFFLPALLMTGVFWLEGLTPFGGGSLGVMDLSHQYLSFLASLRDILAGRAGILYLPSMCLGGNMLGVFAYYLASPLDLLSCLFPAQQLLTAVSVTYILRVGLCGLTMCLYAGCRRGWGWRCLVPALSYAFMGYMTAYSFNYLWQDSVALLPVTALGIARLAEGKRPWLYMFSLAAALVMNFYIGYILCLFSVLFFLCELLSRPREAGALRCLGRFAAASVGAGALGAVLLLPALLSLQGGKAGLDLSQLTLTPNFTLADFLSKAFPGAFRYEEIMPEGLPQIYCGTVTVCLALLGLVNRKITVRRRIVFAALFLLIALCSAFRGPDLVWHAFNTPTWYNCRYSFLLAFLLAAGADAALAEPGGIPRGLPALAPAAVAAAAAYTFIGRTYAYVSWVSGLAAVLIAAVLALCLLLRARPGISRGPAAALAAAVLLLHAGELAVSARVTLDRLTAQATDAAGFAGYVTEKAEAFALADTGTEFARVESPESYSQNRCEPMLFCYDGLSHYGSTLKGASLRFLDRLGLDTYDLWAQYGPGVTAAADTLLGVRFLVSSSPLKDYEAVQTAGRYTVYENKTALPLAFTVPDSFALPLPDGDSFTVLDALYAAAAPEAAGRIFVPAESADPVLENYTRDDARFVREELAPAKITFAVTARADGPLYAEFDIPDTPGVMLYADGVLRAWTATAQTNGTAYLGEYAAGDEITVTLQASADITLRSAAFVTEDRGVIAAYADALQSGGCPLTRLSSSRFEGSFTTGEGDGLLLLTLPWDSSWHVTLDGVPAETVMVRDCLMALPVPPGTHTVTLRYLPAGLVPGAVISAAAVLAVVLLLCLPALRKRRGTSRPRR